MLRTGIRDTFLRWHLTPVRGHPTTGQTFLDTALEIEAGRARSFAESEAPIYEARIADATKVGSVTVKAALQAEFDAMWAEVAQVESELATARTVLGDLEARL